MTLPKLDLKPVPDWQKQRLERWLAEWEIEIDLRAADAEDAVSETRKSFSGDLPVSPLAEEPPPAVGQIRLLSPEITSAGERLVYVALMESNEQGAFLTIPYGRFSEPCLPTELLSDRETAHLRVLCFWNAAFWSPARLAMSWVVDELTDKEFTEALIVLESIRDGHALPDSLARRVGPQCWHPADPRRPYVQEERQFVMKLLEVRETESLTYPTRDAELPKAAEPHTPYEAGGESDSDRSDGSDKSDQTDPSDQS